MKYQIKMWKTVIVRKTDMSAGWIYLLFSFWPYIPRNYLPELVSTSMLQNAFISLIERLQLPQFCMYFSVFQVQKQNTSMLLKDKLAKTIGLFVWDTSASVRTARYLIQFFHWRFFIIDVFSQSSQTPARKIISLDCEPR